MRLADYPRRSIVKPVLVERLSVDARCCKASFSRRRTAVLGLFRVVRCPRCSRRAFILEATTDRDWSRWCGDLAQRRFDARGRAEA